jgi:hypothetical protein
LFPVRYELNLCYIEEGRLCGLAVGVPGYRSRGPGFDSRDFLRSSGSGTGSTHPREYK